MATILSSYVEMLQAYTKTIMRALGSLNIEDDIVHAKLVEEEPRFIEPAAKIDEASVPEMAELAEFLAPPPAPTPVETPEPAVVEPVAAPEPAATPAAPDVVKPEPPAAAAEPASVAPEPVASALKAASPKSYSKNSKKKRRSLPKAPVEEPKAPVEEPTVSKEWEAALSEEAPAKASPPTVELAVEQTETAPSSPAPSSSGSGSSGDGTTVTKPPKPLFRGVRKQLASATGRHGVLGKKDP